MDLCGWVLPSLLGFFAVLLFLSLAAGFPNGRGRWRGIPLRAVMLLGLNVLVLAVAAALLNNQYAFYASWSDLAGGSPPAQVQHFGGSPDQSQTLVEGATLAAVAKEKLPSLPNAGRRLQRFQVTGERSRFNNEVLVRLPENYNPNSGKRYPVILALHGFPSNPSVFRRLGNFFSDLDAAARKGRMAQAIVVMPQINHPRTLDTECVDAPGGPAAETWLSRDIPKWVMSHFAAQPGRASWATYGYSFGGWCAAMLGVRHPNLFGGAVVLQGYFRPDFDKSFRPLRAGSPEYQKYDLVQTVRANPQPLAMWILASKQDRLSYPATKEFSGAIRAPLSVTAVFPEWGGHRTSVWEGQIPRTFEWLGKTLRGFRPR